MKINNIFNRIKRTTHTYNIRRNIKRAPKLALITTCFMSPTSAADTFVKSNETTHNIMLGKVKECTKIAPKVLAKTNISKQKITKHTKLNSKYERTVEELNSLINALLVDKPKVKKQNNPLYNKGKVFLAMGEKYGINPSIIASVAMVESARGTSVAALKKNNVGGIMGKHSLRTFKNVDECIEKMAQVLQKRLKENYTTVEQLGMSGRYCDKSVGKKWTKDVLFFANNL